MERSDFMFNVFGPLFDEESGYVLAVFLVLIALLSATVATFSLTSVYSLQETNATRDREVSFQMAKAGLDIWIGQLRRDWKGPHGGAGCTPGGSLTGGGSDDGGDGGSEEGSEGLHQCPYENFDKSYCGKFGGMTSIKMRCCPRSEQDDAQGGHQGNCPTGNCSVYYEHHDHAWGWNTPILGTSTWLNETKGDTIYLPSESEWGPFSGDLGYFRILLVEQAKGEFLPDDKTGITSDDVSCRSSSDGQTRINVNTASYNHLSEVDGLSDEAAKEIVENRTGNDDEGLDFSHWGGFTLREELNAWNTSWGADHETFTSRNEVCDFIENKTGDRPDDGCDGQNEGGIWNELFVMGPQQSQRRGGGGKEYSQNFCVEIEGGAIECKGSSCFDYDITGRYRIRAKVQRPRTNQDYECSMKVLNLEEL